MRKRIFWSILLAAVLAALVMGAVVLVAQYRLDEERVYEELAAECGYMQAGLSGAKDEGAYLSDLSTERRITLVNGDGTVAFDNQSNAASLPNHMDRPEIAEAMAGGHGKSARYSHTQLMKNLYYALRLTDGRILRVSTARTTILGMVDALATPAFLILLLIIVGSVLLSRLLSRRIVEPINRLNLDAPLSNTIYDEMAPLLTRMEHQRLEITEQMAKLTEKQREFTAVTEHMREGMLLLDKDDRVLSINASAAAIFRVLPEEANGNYILAVSRSTELGETLRAAKENRSGEGTFMQNGRAYRALANDVFEEDVRLGTVLLLLDVTDQLAAERSRREFTANVSHELKTPLTSISGYAEILRDGVAKPEDVARFSGKIYEEANRLMRLIQDIIRLSQLDEQSGMPEKTQVNLYELCMQAESRLRAAAEAGEVSVTVTGEKDVCVSGIPKLLEEMVVNLMDNAVKYNRPGGSVTAKVSMEAGRPVLAVSDTGIGIPQDQQTRVFERFYRVDKSRSKAIGGTGLGLSIVKHGAEIHGAMIHLKSAPEEGTTVELRF